MSKGQKNISLDDYFFGRVAVALGFVTLEELRSSLRRLREDENGATLEQVMLGAGLLTGEKVKTVHRVRWRRQSKHIDPEVQAAEERALGRAVLAAGTVGVADLETALLEKDRLARAHIQVHLGEVLVNRGLVDADEVRELLRSQRGEIRHCAACDLNFRVHPGVPERRWKCPVCGGRLDSVEFLNPIEADGEVG
jgi:hypothetical protein